MSVVTDFGSVVSVTSPDPEISICALSVGAMVASAEPETVLALADRILVLRKGPVAREFKDETVSKDRLLAAAHAFEKGAGHGAS